MSDKTPATKKIVISDAGKATDRRLDQHENYEFGGPWGVTGIIFGFPVLMYYLWICLWFYDGQLVYPKSQADVNPFLARMWAHIVEVRDTGVAALLQSNHIPGRQSFSVCMEGLRGKYHLPALPRLGYAGIPTRGPPCALIKL